MKLLELKIVNFMPYKGEQSVLFPTEASKNVMLVFGANMRGKTSFLNAIRWGLYGRAKARHLREIPRADLVNKEAGDAGDWRMAVHLRFEDGGREYDLRREIKPKKLVVQPKRDSDFDMDVSLRIEGAVQRSDEIEFELSQVIPEQISRFFLFDGELLQEYETLLDDTSEQGKRIKSAIEQILGVPALVSGRDQVRSLLKQAQKAQAKDAKHIKGLTDQASQLETLQADTDSIERDLAKLSETRDRTQSDVAELEQELAATAEAEKAKGEIDGLATELAEIDAAETDAREEMAHLLQTAWVDLLRPLLGVQIRDLEAEQARFRAVLGEKGALEAQIESLRRVHDKKPCPTCGQEVAPEIREDVSVQLGELEVQLEHFTIDSDRLTEVSVCLSDLRKLRSGGEGRAVSRQETALAKFNVRRVRIESREEELRVLIEGQDTADIARKRGRHKALVKNLGKLEDSIRKAEEKLEINRRKVQQLSEILGRDPKARQQRSQRLVEQYTALETVFNRGIEELRDALRTQVEQKATLAFSELTTESGYSRLAINESYGLRILDSKGREVRERSAGAEQVVALSLIDGLNRTARKSGPIVMDTPLGRLDPGHRNNVLTYLPAMGDQIVLLVHQGEIDKDRILDDLKRRVGAVYEIQRVSESESKIVSA